MVSFPAFFDGDWYCCVCRSESLLANPNSFMATTCESESCSHQRCFSCILAEGGGGGGDGASMAPQKAMDIPGQPTPPINLDNDEMGGAAHDGSWVCEYVTFSSRSSSVTEHRAAVASNHNATDPTHVHTTPTTVSNTAKTALARHTTAGGSDDKSENLSVASSIDHLYPKFSTALGKNLARDLNDVDLTRSEDTLAARLEEFSLRFGNEDASENHLRVMSIVYRHSRYD